MIATTEELADPDTFAAELQHWLLVEGPRSANVRRLWRIARKTPGSELEGIFETMLAELKRAARESRVPTAWNLPTRCWEWCFENAKLTPPREAVMTLVYAGLFIIGIEIAKDRVLPTQTDQRWSAAILPATLASSDENDLPSYGTSQYSEASNQVDQWFAEEVASAMDQILESDEFKEKLRRVIFESIDREIAETVAVGEQRPINHVDQELKRRATGEPSADAGSQSDIDRPFTEQIETPVRRNGEPVLSRSESEKLESVVGDDSEEQQAILHSNQSLQTTLPRDAQNEQTGSSGESKKNNSEAAKELPENGKLHGNKSESLARR